MAKQNYLKLAVVIVLSMAASSAAYAATTTLTGVTSIGGSSFATSNKVQCYYVSDSSVTSAFNGTSYGIACGHLSGDKSVSAVSGDAKLYFSTTTSGAATAAAAAITTASSSTWVSM